MAGPPRIPGKGEIAIFNRSHYEDVLVVRVHDFVPEAVWRKRYDQINAFERMLTDEGTTIIKFFLLIDRDEQKQRLQARSTTRQALEVLGLGDLAERKLWDDYVAAYEDVPRSDSTDSAPVVRHPGQPEWFREPRGRADRRRHARGPGPALPAAARPQRGPRHRVIGLTRSDRMRPGQRPIDADDSPVYDRP